MPSEKNAVHEADSCHLNLDAKGLLFLTVKYVLIVLVPPRIYEY
jgi:hypothetical protein